jgi:threo-3-hydroxy-L-aspartate ammonia-lyase
VALVTVAEVEDAAERLDGVAYRTPLLRYPPPHGPLRLKAESLQPTGAFKVRGAYAAISALTPAQRQRGVVAHSSGNHAQAVAYAASLLGVPAVVVVPENAPEVKVAAARRLGATIVVSQPSLAARQAATAELISRHGYALVPPFDDPAVIAGQGTVGLEIAADCPQTDLVLVPVGGGGLISGVAVAIRARCPGAAVIGVEPELAADARDSLSAGERVAWPPELTARTCADALRVDQVGELTFEHMRQLVDAVVTVSEAQVRAAVRDLATAGRLVAEPAGAVAVAAWLSRRDALPAAATPVAVVSGGNIDPAVFADILCDATQ